MMFGLHMSRVNICVISTEARSQCCRGHMTRLSSRQRCCSPELSVREIKNTSRGHFQSKSISFIDSDPQLQQNMQALNFLNFILIVFNHRFSFRHGMHLFQVPQNPSLRALARF